MDDLEPTQVPAEPTEPVPPVEPAPPVSPEPPEDVSGEKEEPTFKQADVDAQILEKEKDWQSRKDIEFQPLKDEIEKLKKGAEDSKLQTLEEREITQWGDTPEVKEFHAARRQFTEDKRNTEILAAQTALTSKTNLASELAGKYEIDKKSLLECESPEEMRVKALELAIEKKDEKLAEVKKAPQVVDSGVQNIPGVDFDKMTPQEMIKWGLEHPKK